MTAQPDKKSRLIGPLTGAHSYETAPMMVRTAQDADIDDLGHVNNTVYLTWSQEVATAHWMSVVDLAVVSKFLWVVLRHEIDYRDPVLAGETVEIRTWLGRASGPRFARHVDIRKPGAARAAAKVLTVWCLIDAATRRPKRVGPEIFKSFGVEG